MLQKRFVYDPERFDFLPKRVSRREVKWFVLRSAVLGMVLAVVFGAAAHMQWGGLDAWLLQQENGKLYQQIVQKDQELARVENELEKVHKNDNAFYRSLLNLPRTDNAVWNAGKGGADERLIPAGVRKLRERMFRLNYKVSLQRQSMAEVARTAELKKEELAHMPVVKPLGSHIVSGFGYRISPFHSGYEFHSGLDFHARMGTPVKATGQGKVITAGYSNGGYGLEVEIAHGFGYVTKYAHLSQLKVNVGDVVERGQVIGLTGNTGLSTGPHLHYEVIRNGAKVNPYDYFYSE